MAYALVTPAGVGALTVIQSEKVYSRCDMVLCDLAWCSVLSSGVGHHQCGTLKFSLGGVLWVVFCSVCPYHVAELRRARRLLQLNTPPWVG